MKQILIFFGLIIFYNTSFSQLTTIEYKFDESRSGFTVDNIENRLTEVFKIDKNIKFAINDKLTYVDDIGFEHFTYTQEINSIPIEFSNLKLHYKEGKLVYANGDIAHKANGLTKKIDENQALEFALNSTKNKNFVWNDKNFYNNSKEYMDWTNLYPKPKGQLVYIYVPNIENPKLELAYKFDIFCQNPDERNWVYVSAVTGEILFKNSQICNSNGTAETKYTGTKTISTTQVTSTNFSLKDNGSGRCNINTFKNSIGLNYADNNNIWTTAEYNNIDLDQAALDAHWGAEMFYDYLKTQHNQLSIDNANFNLIGIYSNQAVDNAYWNGSNALFYKGDYRFKPLTSLDVVAHEFGHGLCSKTCNLVYQNEPGALNESLSDIWGACVEAFAAPNKSKWLIGEDIDKIRPSLRSMSNPNAEGQPDTYLGLYWYNGTGDYGGVHTNSGVQNFWFYLLTEGGSGTNDIGNAYNVQGIGILKASKIIFRAETVYYTNSTNYANARLLTIQAAKDLFGACSDEVKSVINAWHAVGIGSNVITGNTLTIVDPVQPNTFSYKVGYITVQASNIIKPMGNATYESLNSVIMTPGFEAQTQSNYLAQIIDCNNTNGGLKVAEVPNNNHEVTNSSETSEFKISVYPIPFKDKINVELNMDAEQNTYFRCININGQVLYEDNLQNQKNEIDLSKLSPGIYFIKVTKDKQESTVQIIKE